MSTVGFIGTGAIGGPMAQRLVEAGHQVLVHDRVAGATHALVEAGARDAGSPREVAGECRIVMTSLPGPPEVAAVIGGSDGTLAGAQPGDVHVDLSTSSFDGVKRMHALASDAGVHYLDAPVSGGIHGARKGTLTVMASGDAGAFERARPLLESFAKNIFHLGEAPGAGTLVKLINNAIFLCSGIVLQEGFVMAAKAGLDPERLLEIVKVSSGNTFAGLADMTLGRDFENVIFRLALAEKDVGLACESGETLGVPMPVTAAAHGVYRDAVAAGLGDEVFFATLKTLEAAAGTEVPIAPRD